MRKILFLNGVAAYPTAELHAAQKVEVLSSTDFNLVANSYSTRHNHFNPLGRPLTYFYENHRANSVAKFFNKRLGKIKIKNSQMHLSNEVIDRLEMGVMSSISSYLRVSDYSQLNHRWRTIHKNLLNTSKNVFCFFYDELQNYDQLLIYNGRFVEDAAAKLAAEVTETSYKVYDFKKAGSYYEFIDTPLHSTTENCKRAKLYYLEDVKKAHYVANQFMSSKISGVATYEKSYTANQSTGTLNQFINNKDKIIAVYPSSDDEYRFLGPDWGVEPVGSQVKEVEDLALNINSDYKIVVRMHPNMIDMQKDIYESYISLGDYSNIIVIPADSTVSTYELIERAQYVICFCSTVAVEANFMRKLVIGIGGNPYYHLPVAHYVQDAQKASSLINSNILNLKSKTASIIWMNYLWKYSQENEYIKKIKVENNIHRGSEFHFKLRSSHFFRLLASFDRLELRLKKGSKLNKANLREMLISVKDIALNKSSNKFVDIEKN